MSRRTNKRRRWLIFFVDLGYVESKGHIVHNNSQLPPKGCFFREYECAGKKADIILGLHDGRAMLIECKVSNSATNSIKRLADATNKAVIWTKALGSANVIPAAVLTGVFKVKNLLDAQAQNLTVFWSHDLKTVSDFLAEAQP